MKVEVTTDIFNEDTFKLIAEYKFEKCGGSWSNTVPEEELEKIPRSFVEMVGGFVPPSNGFHVFDSYESPRAPYWSSFLWRVVRVGDSEYTVHQFEPIKKYYRVSVVVEESVLVEAESEEEAKEIVEGYGPSDFDDEFNLDNVEITDAEVEDDGEIMGDLVHQATAEFFNNSVVN